MKWRKIVLDPSFWILLAANIYLVYKYEQNPKIFATLIWLYWSQNMLYGFFNFLDILTTKNIDLSTQLQPSAASDNPVDKKADIRNGTAWIFLFHFGFFHLVYFIFLRSMDETGPFDWMFFKYYLLVFLVFQVVNFIQHKIQNRNRVADLGRMFFTPYLRVIPMHLCILLPAFLHITGLTVFLILKVIADMLMYLITNSPYKKPSIAELTAMNIKSTLLPD